MVLLKSNVLTEVQRSMIDGGMLVEGLPVDPSPHLGQPRLSTDSLERESAKRLLVLVVLLDFGISCTGVFSWTSMCLLNSHHKSTVCNSRKGECVKLSGKLCRCFSL